MVAALAGRDGATVHITKSDGQLIVQVVSPMTDPDVVAEVTDRVGALDGSLRVERTAHGTQVTAEVPCA
jgi:hypothetical protein